MFLLLEVLFLIKRCAIAISFQTAFYVNVSINNSKFIEFEILLYRIIFYRK